MKKNKLPNIFTYLSDWIANDIPLIITIVMTVISIVMLIVIFVYIFTGRMLSIISAGILIFVILSFLFLIVLAKNQYAIMKSEDVLKTYKYNKATRISTIIIIEIVILMSLSIFVYTPSRLLISNSLINTPKASPTGALTLTPTLNVTSIPGDISVLLTDISDLKVEVVNLKKEIDTLTNQSGGSDVQSSQYKNNVQALDNRIKIIEQAILDNPEKSLALTLLSRDIDNTTKEVERLYDLFKWFFGLMFTMALSLLGLAVSNFIKKPEKQKDVSNSRKED